LGELVYVARAESAPYSNHDWVWRPFGIVVPFRMALVGVIEVAAWDVTIGTEPELLFSPPPPPPPPPQPIRRDTTSRHAILLTEASILKLQGWNQT
jgi:hypothetical protein